MQEEIAMIVFGMIFTENSREKKTLYPPLYITFYTEIYSFFIVFIYSLLDLLSL